MKKFPKEPQKMVIGEALVCLPFFVVVDNIVCPLHTIGQVLRQ